MGYANSRAITINHLKVPSDQANFPFLFTAFCDTLASGINAAVTTISPTNGGQVQDGDNIQIGSETMTVTAGGGTSSYTVLRAQFGTVAASHLAGAVITNLFLASVANGGGVTNASGFDIIFATDAAGTSPVAYERVVWTAAQGLTEAHVVSQPTSASDYVMYVLWGNAAITTDQSNPTGTWDANFKLISHLPNGTALTVGDSTGLNVGTNHGATATAGQIDGAAAFNGSTQFIDYGNSTPLNITGDITAEAWINAAVTSTNVILGQLTAAVTNGYQFYLAGNSMEWVFENAGFLSFLTTNNVISGNVWFYVSGKRTGGTMKILVNGVDPGIFQSQNQGSSTTGSSTEPFFVGKNAAGFFWQGGLDEIRMSNIARSDNWLITSYNSQSSPNTFYLLGANTPINPASRVTQAIVEIMILQNPSARVTQAVVEICVLAFVPPPPIPGQGVAITGGGPASIRERSKGGCNPKVTHYDWCLEAEGALMRKITFPPSCSIPQEYCNLLPWDDTYGATPEQSFPFLKQAGIVTPTTVSGDNVVVSFRVTSGYDGLLSGFYFNYSGAGFSQGSGDIVWRVQINQRYVKDLSNVPFLLGDPVNPIPMTQGQIITSGQTVRAIVSIPNLSGMIQIGNSTVYAGLLGFFWPR